MTAQTYGQLAGVDKQLLEQVRNNTAIVASGQNADGTPFTPGDSVKATYRASITGLIVNAAATDIFTLIGSATKTVRVTRVGVSGVSGSAITVDVVLVKRSAADTVGTSTAPAAIPLDSADAAGTAVAKAYTVNPTLGAAVGTVAVKKAMFGTSADWAIPAEFEFGAPTPAKPVVLRGVAEQLAVNLGGATVTSPLIDVFVEWTEE